MAKRVVKRPEWLDAPQVVDVYSVSGCVSEDFADCVTFWPANGLWLFDSSEVIEQMARENAIDLQGTSLFYYEVYEQEFDEIDEEWASFELEPPLPTEVVVPLEKEFAGYDVVSFSLGGHGRMLAAVVQLLGERRGDQPALPVVLIR